MKRNVTRRNISQIISKMVMVAILSSLGVGLMFLTFPYPFAPWIQFDPSDTVILVAYALTGFWGSFSVAIIKTLINFFVSPVSAGGAIGVGQLAAFFTSMSYVLGIYIFSHLVKWFKKGFVWRIVSYVLISLLVATIMALLNMFFVTPSFMVGDWATCFTPGAIDNAIDTLIGMNLPILSNLAPNFFLFVFVIYFPFNLIKAAGVCLLYEILCNYLIFVVFKKNKFFCKYFSKGDDKKCACTLDSTKCELEHKEESQEVQNN